MAAKGGGTDDLSVKLNTGTLMPLVGLGTYKICLPDVMNDVIQVALDAGYRSFDTAAIYGNEAVIGRALRELLPKKDLRREDVFVTTKLAPREHGTELCRKAFEKSLAELDLNYVDLYLIHWPGVQGRRHDDEMVPKLRRESWLQLEEFHRKGKAKAIGVSNYTLTHLKELLTYCSVKPAVLQVEYHPHFVQSELLEFCRENGVHLQAYSSLGTSTMKWLRKDEVVLEIAKKVNKTPVQVLLRWAVQQEIGVIPKSVHSDFIKSNYEIGDFSLDSADIDRLNTLGKNTDLRYCWDPQMVI